MHKYDFGYEIKTGSTMEWAFDAIHAESKVLELGTAIGTLTKHLCEDKKCIVDIVEIDEESGKKAVPFARKSYIGLQDGDIELYKWYSELKNERYDYIVILDVLEHLRNGKKLLECVYKLLKDEGVLLLSVPNIAHNSILIDLFNNNFNYSELGLLDETHVHFYSYESLCKVLNEVNLFPFEKDAIQLRVNENEILNSYDNIPYEVAAALRAREYADAYQFLFKIRKKEENDVEFRMQVENLPYTLFATEILNSKNEVVFQKFINPNHKLDLEINCDLEKDEWKLTLLNTYCVVKDLELKAECDGQEIVLPIKHTNAAKMNDIYLFMSQDSQMVFEKNENISCIKISGEILSYGAKVLEYVNPIWSNLLEKTHQIKELDIEQKKLYDYISLKEEYIKQLLDENQHNVNQIHEYEKQREELRTIIEEKDAYIKTLQEKQ